MCVRYKFLGIYGFKNFSIFVVEYIYWIKILNDVIND